MNQSFWLSGTGVSFQPEIQTKVRLVETPMTLSESLRAAILNSKQTRYAIARGAQIDHAVLRRFMNRERDIKLKTAESLAHYLELELVKKKKRSKKTNGK